MGIPGLHGTDNPIIFFPHHNSEHIVGLQYLKKIKIPGFSIVNDESILKNDMFWKLKTEILFSFVVCFSQKTWPPSWEPQDNVTMALS